MLNLHMVACLQVQIACRVVWFLQTRSICQLTLVSVEDIQTRGMLEERSSDPDKQNGTGQTCSLGVCFICSSDAIKWSI